MNRSKKINRTLSKIHYLVDLTYKKSAGKN